MIPFSRRRLLQLATAAPLAAIGGNSAPETVALTISARVGNGAGPFAAADYGYVGVYDADWLTTPGYTRMLDHFAASPGAFAGVRFFGALSSGTRENTRPENGGTLWPDPTAPPDFAATFAALHALTSRGLTPFVQLSFFPGAVSPAPVLPPASWQRWQSLVRGFLDGLASDPRFGIAQMRTWWFEVWNEPNFPHFWGGTFAQYLDLYRATSEAVRDSGYPVRLGGPTLAWIPAQEGIAAGEPLMRRFLTFLRDEPGVRCDFLSYHAKGSWDAGGEPDLATLTDAATTVAGMALSLVPDRCRDLPIINNEADERVGFDTPYAARVDERNTAWLAAATVAHDALSVRYRGQGVRFLAAADNANLHLVQTPYDGRRSLLTRASATDTDPTDLLKIPAYGWYELLRLLGSGRGAVLSGNDDCYPRTSLFHLLTNSPTHVAALFVNHPRTAGEMRMAQEVAYELRDLPWPAVNVVRFVIDGTYSNGFAAAGGHLSPPFPDAATAARIRTAAELTVAAPIRHGVMTENGTLRERFTLPPYAVALLWVTPFDPAPPAAPAWFTAEQSGANVWLRWEPSRDPAFYSSVLTARAGNGLETIIAPVPLRAACWTDTAPFATDAPGPRTYTVKAMSASGVESGTAMCVLTS